MTQPVTVRISDFNARIPMLLLTNHTRRRAVIDRDAIWLGHLLLLWTIAGHVVTLTRMTDAGPFPCSPTVPRATGFDRDTDAAAR